MFKKVLLGLAAVAIACALARSGYGFGQYLAHKDKAKDPQTSATGAGQG